MEGVRDAVLGVADVRVGGRVVSLEDFDAAAGLVVAANLRLASDWAASPGIAQMAQYLLDYGDACQAMVDLGLGPWLTLTYARLVAESDDVPYTTRAYAKYGMVSAAANAVAHVMNAYDNDQSDAECSALLKLQQALLAGFSDAGGGTALMDRQISMVLSRADDASQSVAEVAGESAKLGERTTQTSNLKVNADDDQRQVQRARWLFFAWLAAYISVVGVASYLVFTDQLMLFGVLAVVAIAVSMLELCWGLVSRRSSVS
jgi:hypothetical protein